MKRDNVNYVLVGAVVVAAFVLLMVTLSMISGRSGASTDYYTHYRNVTGLRFGAPVFYEGFRIGQVGKIIPERGDKGTSYKIEIDVRKDWPIPKDSIAHLTSTGLLADVAIGITEGVSKDPAAPGSELKGAESADIFAAMNELAVQITTLTRDQIAPLIKNLSQHVDSIASVIDKNTPELVEQSRILLGKLNTASDSMNDVLKPDNRKALAAILSNTRDLTHELQSTQQKLDDALAQLDSIAKENRPGVRQAVDDLRAVLAALSGRVDSIMQHLEVASRNFDEFAREVRKSPNRLLISPKADKLQENEQ
ncbi:MAG TPA: MlaD family protein [Rudaea sp.]|jgi:phospholipid/cholesterol/gamma-HCH transport system substrate-binding protein|nr:MlaD family protein [Rudaea sp.]